MFTLLLMLFLLLSLGVLLFLKSKPGLKPVAFALPVIALLLFMFRPAPSTNRRPQTDRRFQQELARITGSHLAMSLTSHLPSRSSVLILHPERRSHVFQQIQGRHFLAGIESGLETHAGAVHVFPVQEELYINTQTLRRALSQYEGVNGLILIGMQIMADPDLRSLSLPPMVLSDLGDPGSSEWALQNGVAKAALFSKDSAEQLPERPGPEAYFTSRYEIRTVSDLQ
ncbi:MAG: hypothetical protein JJU05_15425 [Verrucomicrobia bacterium]|nr:hypothetical protein [Verrucomicrobiota bacterium]MCH8527417.1 hypothetical protein [Kiritimatiellia bacterium]